VAGGMNVDKVVRVVGLADSNLLNKDNPRDPLNRRIAIIVMNKIAEEKMNKAGGELDAGSAEDVERGLAPEGAAPAQPGTPNAAAPAPAPATAGGPATVVPAAVSAAVAR
jgi:chemotaxis protein MotB